MEESISGFKCRGSWGEVVEHGERITRALRESGVEGAHFDDWDEWRPKSHERLGEDVNEKTAKQASVGEGEGEKEGKAPNEDLKTAGEKLSRSYEKIEAGDDEGAVESWQDSINYVARAADSAGRKALRKVEDTVYRKVMTQLAPYYFDNELISANIQQVGRGTGDEVFVFEVNVNDDGLKTNVSEMLRNYEDEVDRWHIDTEKETEVAEVVEGVEVPVTDAEKRSKSTTN
ncbi:hypothetical protein GJR96_05555 [Haloferax sp. MBLA0076]|uniref:Uncharacterized protein n=1 Tax=Haloferax litoreum TaxID=2666140 RepID=A0A6A8GF11_9EURY|nr:MULTISPECIES: DUF5828 family protein [Haloferax]KAB1192939.1 hypothetical protein Hfx1148_05550 [Haloferax sp. CBA1148]MRX21426.1 hypothetical protein [Haloferax litoreum]